MAAAEGIDDLIAKYTGTDPERFGGRTVPFSTRISVDSKLKLEALAAHFGLKKTPLFGEIAEAAINDMFDRLHDDMDEDIQRGYAEEVHHYQTTGEY